MDSREILIQFFGNDAKFLSYELFGNTVADYTTSVILLVVALVVFKIFQVVILRHLKKLAGRTSTDIDDTLIAIVHSVKPPFYMFLAFYVALQNLTLVGWVAQVVNAILTLWITFLVVNATGMLINYILNKQLKDEEDLTTKHALSLLGRVAMGILWGVGILMVLSNLGVNISSLLAGVGIGGIAIAFALQNILSDLFSSFAIYFDKPFQIGDYIVVGEHSGVVEKIGIKTSRIRALQGEEIVISNQELTSARVQNFKKLKERRVVFPFGLVYEIPTAKLKEVPGIVEAIIKEIDGTRFDRAHFKSFGDSSLDHEVVYYVTTGDYATYMNVQQEINWKLKEELEAKGMGFAYPTQTVYVEKT